MFRRDRHASAEPAHDGRDADWDNDWEAPARPRKGLVRRVFGLVKLAVFLTPLAVFVYGSLVADCRSRPSFTGWAGFLGAGACARNEIVGSAFSMQDNLAVLKRLID